MQVLRGIHESDWPRIKQVAIEVHSSANLEIVLEVLASHYEHVTVSQDRHLPGGELTIVYATRVETSP